MLCPCQTLPSSTACLNSAASLLVFDALTNSRHDSSCCAHSLTMAALVSVGRSLIVRGGGPSGEGVDMSSWRGEEERVSARRWRKRKVDVQNSLYCFAVPQAVYTFPRRVE